MLKSSYKILTVWGIPIRLHVSLVILVAFLASDFGLMTAIWLEIGLLTSIALHELGHSLVAIKKGCRVREILLMPIGGAARMESMPTRPRDEFLMALAGPLVSLFLGLTGFFAAERLLITGLQIEGPIGWQGVIYLATRIIFGESTSFLIYSGAIIAYLAMINCVLVGFNLLPSFPMDGGRVLRAVLTPKFGRLKATFIAARLGRFMAVLFGLFALFGHEEPSWTLFAISLFIYIVAGNEYKMVQMQEAAKRRGPFFGSFFESNQPSESWWSDDADSDKVSVSPPPYEKGPDSETDIHTEDSSNPFGSFFNR